MNKKGPKDLVFPEDMHLVNEKIQARLSGKTESFHYEFRGITKNKKVVTVEAYGTRTVYQGRPAVIGTFLDITDRRRSEEALHNERQRFQALADNAPFGMVLIDNQGNYTYINPRFKEILGYDLTDVPNGRTWFRKAYPDPDYRQAVISEWLSDLKNPNPVQKRSKVFTVSEKDGTKREISFMFGWLNTGEILMTCEDITIQKRLEAQLLQSQKMEAIGTLAGGIAHDFNNLLMTILGYTSLMLMDKDSQHPDFDKLKIIEGQIQSGADLTRQLLGFARGGKYEIKPTNLNELLARSSEMFGRTKKEISIYMKQEKELWPVEVDRGQIEQVFLNLFVNAWQAMPHGGNIYVETENITIDHLDQAINLKKGDYVKIKIADTGMGMDKQEQEKAFEPFYTTKEVGRGTGLGLSITYGIVKQHKGYITIYSEKGRGTTFKIYLPVAGGTATVEKPVRPVLLATGKETIFYAEDDQAVRKATKTIMEEYGYQVIEASDGEDALNKISQYKNEIHLFILDVIMPKKNGKEVFEEIKKIRPEAKVIFTSGYTKNIIEQKGILEDGFHFLSKPLIYDELIKKIREIIET